MTEADFQIEFGKWKKHNRKITEVFELKITKTNTVAFSAIKPHQKNALRLTKHEGIYYKLPDDSMQQKPYDCVFIKAPAYIVVMFYRRGQKEFFIIDIDVWLDEEEKCGRGSISESRAAELGERARLGTISSS